MSFIAVISVLALSIVAMYALMGPGAETRGLARQVPRLGPWEFRTLALLILAAILVSLVLLVVEVIRKRRSLFPRESQDKPDYTFLLLFLTAGATLAVFIFVLAFAFSLLPTPDDTEKVGLPEITGQDEETEEELPEERFQPEPEPEIQVDRRDASRQILAVLALAGGAVAASLAIRYMRSVRKANVIEDEESYRELREDLARSARIGLDRVISEPDHRMAVIAAYAYMEETFADHGFAREESQTPKEYMEATLSGIEAALRRGSARAQLPRRELLVLTRLYEVAKFSLHEITGGDRQKALESLRQVEASVPKSAVPGAST